MSDHPFAVISRRSLLGASSAMLALGLAAPLSRAVASEAASGAEASTQAPSRKGAHIAISTVGTSIYFDSRAFKAQVEAVRRLGGTPITLDTVRSDKPMVTQLQNLVTHKPDAVIHTIGSVSVSFAATRLAIKRGQTLRTLSIIDPWFRRIGRGDA